MEVSKFFQSLWMRVQTRSPKQPRRRRPLVVENLEERSLLSVTLPTAGTPGPVTITGTARSDQFVIAVNADDATKLDIKDSRGSSAVSVAIADVTGITAQGLAGRDELVLDQSHGLIGAAGGLAITFEGGAGMNTLLLVGDAGPGVSETVKLGDASAPITMTIENADVSATIQLVDAVQIHDAMTADSLTIDTSDAAEQLRLTNGPGRASLTSLRLAAVQKPAAPAMEDDAAEDSGIDDPFRPGRHRPPSSTDRVKLPKPTEMLMANKAAVTVDANGGDDKVLVDIRRTPTGLTALTIDGGDGSDTDIVRAVPSDVALTKENFEAEKTNTRDNLIADLYQRKLHRSPGEGEIGYWRSVLEGASAGAGAGADASGIAAVAQGIDNSTEARGNVVRGWYGRYLGREARNGEEMFWVNQLNRGTSQEQVLQGILSSAEFQAIANAIQDTGSTDEKFIQTLYNTVLNRTASETEVGYWQNVLPIVGRSGVAAAFLASEEFRAGQVSSLYEDLLGRSADSAGLAYWVASSLDLSGIQEAIAESEECQNRA